MKIRTQLNLLIIFMVIIPLICLLTLPAYHYITSPQRRLFKGYNEIRKLHVIDLTDDDWRLLKEQLKKIPPHVQALVYYNYTVILSTMPEIKADTQLSPIELFNLIERTSNAYDYQLLSSVQPEGEGFPATAQYSKFLVMFRAKVSGQKKRPLRNLYMPAFAGLLCFELLCIVFLVHLSNVIASSITFLEKSALRIADGDLNTEVETHKSRQESNEITMLAEGLEKMRDSLRDAEGRRTKFIMGISHDLRTPVALIKGYTEAITDGVVDDMDEVKKSLSIIYAKADQLESMINDLINYVKLNNTDWRQMLEYVSLRPVLAEFAENANITAEIYRRTITSSVEVGGDVKIPMDRNLFTRALENLFSNALRYTRDGDSIDFSAREEGASVTISIRDSGIGISEKDLEHIYDIFYRGTNSRREGGMGIGLSVVKTIIDTHGWQIDVKSRLNEGTEFIITIPKQ